MRSPIPVTALGPTGGITDPQVRAFLDNLSNAWDLRGGTTDRNSPHRFVTAGEISSLAQTAVLQAISPGTVSGSAGGGSGGGGGGPDSATLIDVLSQSIFNSLLFQKLNEKVRSIDVTAIRDQLTQKFGQLQTGLYAEQKARSDADGQVTNSLTAQISTLSTNVNAAIVSESNTRATEDYTLASAINTIWALVGGSSAVIQDGTLAAATPSSATATRWNQVVSAVTDPNTGNVASASIVQQFNTYASTTNGSLNSLYSLRVQLAAGGTTYTGTATQPSATVNQAGNNLLTLTNQTGTPAVGMYVYGPGIPGGTTVASMQGTSTVVMSAPLNANASNAGSAYTFSTQRLLIGGFGVAATQGSGSAQGATIDFGVAVNRFWIGAPLDSYNPATEFNVANAFPFIVVTTPTVINGITFQPGVYMKKVFIADASIDTAKIYYNLHSNNFDGTFNTDGSISGNGSAGWAIDKNGTAVFNNAFIRGTLDAGIVKTDNIVGNALTDAISPAPTSAQSVTFTAGVAAGTAGAAAMLIHASCGESFYGSGVDIHTEQTRFTIACAGQSQTFYCSGVLVITAPATGVYTVTVTCQANSQGQSWGGFAPGSQLHCAAMVYKR